MKAEHKIILELCKDINNIELDLNGENLEELDWNEVLWQISAHKIECLLAKKKINNKPLEKVNGIIAKDVKCKYLFYYYRNLFLYEKVLPELIMILNNAVEDYAFTKGIISAVTLYNDIGYRSFGDIDIIIKKSDIKKVKLALNEAGYLFGEYNFEENVINKATPQVIKFFEMTTHQTCPLCKLFEDPICKCVEIDVNFGLGPDKNMKSSTLIDEVLRRKVYYQYKGLKIPSLSREDLFLHNCFQIYRDSTVTFHIKDMDDVKLYQYIDLYKMIKLWHTELDFDYIESISEKFEFKKEVFYALFHCSAIFDDVKSLINPLINKIEPTDKNFLNEFGSENIEKGVWNIPFIERLFAKNRYSLIAATIEKEGFEAFKNREKFTNENF